MRLRIFYLRIESPTAQIRQLEFNRSSVLVNRLPAECNGSIVRKRSADSVAKTDKGGKSEVGRDDSESKSDYRGERRIISNPRVVLSTTRTVGRFVRTRVIPSPALSRDRPLHRRGNLENNANPEVPLFPRRQIAAALRPVEVPVNFAT